MYNDLYHYSTRSQVVGTCTCNSEWIFRTESVLMLPLSTLVHWGSGSRHHWWVCCPCPSLLRWAPEGLDDPREDRRHGHPFLRAMQLLLTCRHISPCSRTTGGKKRIIIITFHHSFTDVLVLVSWTTCSLLSLYQLLSYIARSIQVLLSVRTAIANKDTSLVWLLQVHPCLCVDDVGLTMHI